MGEALDSCLLTTGWRVRHQQREACRITRILDDANSINSVGPLSFVNCGYGKCSSSTAAGDWHASLDCQSIGRVCRYYSAVGYQAHNVGLAASIAEELIHRISQVIGRAAVTG